MHPGTWRHIILSNRQPENIQCVVWPEVDWPRNGNAKRRKCRSWLILLSYTKCRECGHCQRIFLLSVITQEAPWTGLRDLYNPSAVDFGRSSCILGHAAWKYECKFPLYHVKFGRKYLPNDILVTWLKVKGMLSYLLFNVECSIIGSVLLSAPSDRWFYQ